MCVYTGTTYAVVRRVGAVRKADADRGLQEDDVHFLRPRVLIVIQAGVVRLVDVEGALLVQVPVQRRAPRATVLQGTEPTPSTRSAEGGKDTETETETERQ